MHRHPKKNRSFPLTFPHAAIPFMEYPVLSTVTGPYRLFNSDQQNSNVEDIHKYMCSARLALLYLDRNRRPSYFSFAHCYMSTWITRQALIISSTRCITQCRLFSGEQSMNVRQIASGNPSVIMLSTALIIERIRCGKTENVDSRCS